MGPGAGLTSAVSPAGGYAASVPLDLPTPRGSVPVPVSIVHDDSLHAGVAGIGWDVPLSYVRRSTDPWRRKPTAVLGAGEAAPEQVTVVVGGAASQMVRSGDHYVPFAGGAYQELRETGAGWTLTTLDNLEYLFTRARDITPDGGMPDDGLWLLTSVRDRAGRDEVVLRYATDGLDPTRAGCAKELRLASVAYTFSDPAIGKLPLYEILLDYEPWWRPPYPRAPGGYEACTSRPAGATTEEAIRFEHVQDHALSFDRARVLTGIRVLARNNLTPTAAPRRIRAYQLSYGADRATDQPRLELVTTTGEEGTDEGDPAHALTVVRYGYGDAATRRHDEDAPSVEFGERIEIGRFFIPGADYAPGLTTTVPERTLVNASVEFSGHTYVMQAGTRTHYTPPARPP